MMGGLLSEGIASDAIEDTEDKSVTLVHEVRIDGLELPDEPTDAWCSSIEGESLILFQLCGKPCACSLLGSRFIVVSEGG